MRSDEQERPTAARRGRRGRGRRRAPQPAAGPPPAPPDAPAPTPPEQLRAPEEIRAQYEAARAFAGEVTRMMPTSHQYTAGQAAALAWLLEQGPAPLTYEMLAADPPAADPAAEQSSPEAVQRLSERARQLMDGTERNELFPAAYVMGVAYVCEWVRGRTDVLPIPRPDGLPPA